MAEQTWAQRARDVQDVIGWSDLGDAHLAAENLFTLSKLVTEMARELDRLGSRMSGRQVLAEVVRRVELCTNPPAGTLAASPEFALVREDALRNLSITCDVVADILEGGE